MWSGCDSAYAQPVLGTTAVHPYEIKIALGHQRWKGSLGKVHPVLGVIDHANR